MNMDIDSENPVVKYCGQGIEMELKGDTTKALELYMKAWEIKRTDYEACIAAHYIARLQTDYEKALLWNQESLNYAKKVNDESVYVFLPSLYLNIGKSYEELGNKDEAKKSYQSGFDSLYFLPRGDYSDMVKNAIERGIKRVSN